MSTRRALQLMSTFPGSEKMICLLEELLEERLSMLTGAGLAASRCRCFACFLTVVESSSLVQGSYGPTFTPSLTDNCTCLWSLNLSLKLEAEHVYMNFKSCRWKHWKGASLRPPD